MIANARKCMTWSSYKCAVNENGAEAGHSNCKCMQWLLANACLCKWYYCFRWPCKFSWCIIIIIIVLMTIEILKCAAISFVKALAPIVH